jgi:hypothetical protein
MLCTFSWSSPFWQPGWMGWWFVLGAASGSFRPFVHVLVAYRLCSFWIDTDSHLPDERLTKRFTLCSDVVADTLSEEAFACAQKWLAECTGHHSGCTILDSTFTPRRLLNVGSKERSQDPFLFQPTTPCLYAALSYCWGSDILDVLTTTKSNLESHYNAIQLSSLPQTLQDAVSSVFDKSVSQSSVEDIFELIDLPHRCELTYLLIFTYKLLISW